jgi:putative DNA primase/helicase
VAPHGICALAGNLIIPMRDTDGILWDVQTISRNDQKRFLDGGRVLGCCFDIGKLEKRLWIAEGFATGATVREATGDAVACVLSAGNIESVLEAIRSKFPEAEVIIAADNDAQAIACLLASTVRDNFGPQFGALAAHNVFARSNAVLTREKDCNLILACPQAAH